MIHFEPPFSFWLILLGAVVAAAVLGATYLRLQRLVRPSYRWGLTGLRCASFGLVFLLLLNPYRLENRLDRDGFRVAVLADASGSMDTFDLAGGSQSRFELVTEWLAEERASPLATLRERDYRLDLHLFAEETVPFAGGQPRLLPGSTAMGSALRSVLHRRTATGGELGGVLLISDGQSNLGPSPIEVAQEFRQRGIPISAIGVGALRPPGQVSGGFVAERFQGQRGQPMEIGVRVSNTRSNAETVRVELRQGETSLETKEVELAAGAEQVVTFTVTPFQGGGQAYQAVIHRSGAPAETDVAAVQVEEPDTFRILYLAHRPSLELRFIQQALQGAEQISIEAFVQTGAESFFYLLRPEQERLLQGAGFPDDPRFYNGYDAIIVPGPAILTLPNQGELLRDFVQHRGGGLLVIGDPTQVPEEWQALLPVLTVARQLPGARRDLAVEVAPLFHEVAGGSLFGRPPPFLPDEVPGYLATEWKRGARPVIRLPDGGLLMAVQAYGAGRIGWTGTEHTWRWRMHSPIGLEQHRTFWNHSLVWLASAGRPRMAVAYQGERVPLATSLDAGIDVLGPDFRPARMAEVEAFVQSPSGETRRLRLQPSFRQPGRFDLELQPEEAGEHRVRYRVAFPEGEEMSYDAFFVASHHDQERQNTAYREDILRDLARLTGGQFWTYETARGLRDLPLAEGIPTRQTRHYLAHNWFFLTLLSLPLFSEWYIRRKLGLK